MVVLWFLVQKQMFGSVSQTFCTKCAHSRVPGLERESLFFRQVFLDLSADHRLIQICIHKVILYKFVHTNKYEKQFYIYKFSYVNSYFIQICILVCMLYKFVQFFYTNLNVQISIIHFCVYKFVSIYNRQTKPKKFL